MQKDSFSRSFLHYHLMDGRSFVTPHNGPNEISAFLGYVLSSAKETGIIFLDTF